MTQMVKVIAKNEVNSFLFMVNQYMYSTRKQIQQCCDNKEPVFHDPLFFSTSLMATLLARCVSLKKTF